MPDEMPRRLRIQDIMALVAAAAIGLALAGWGYGREFSRQAPASHQILVAYWFATLAALPATVTTALLRLARPRPSRRRLYAQPGFVGCVTVAVVFLCDFLADWGGNLGMMKDAGALRSAVSLSLGYTTIAPAVLCSWLFLLAGGRWRPEPSWVDRLGRALSVLWIASLPAMTLARLLCG